MPHRSAAQMYRAARKSDALLTGAPLCGGRSFALLERFFRQTAELVTGTPCPSAYPAMLRALEAPMPDDVPQFRTTFAGTRQDPAERAVLSGLDEENFAPVPLLYALLRGMADELSACYRAALKAGCAPAGRLLGSGNGLRRNPALQRAVERSFGLPLTLAAVPEEAACGAALRAKLIGARSHKGELDALIRAEDAPLAAGLSCTPANLEQIMVHLEREAEA